MTIEQPRRNRSPRLAALLVLAGIVLFAGLFAGPPVFSQATGAAPEVEIVEDEGGAFATLTAHIKDFQRRANAEIATHMNAIQRGDDLGALFLGLAIAFAYGVIHAFGPGHGKFVIVSYFLARGARVRRPVSDGDAEHGHSPRPWSIGAQPMATVTATTTAAASKAASWPWRRAWSPVREPF